MKNVIAIDGFASTGKSTLSKKLANDLGYTYVDTGYMFRAVCHFALQNGDIKEGFIDKQSLEKRISTLTFSWQDQLDGKKLIAVNGRVMGEELRRPEISAMVSQIASIYSVRSHLLNQQRNLSETLSVVMDGRDIGTVVFPEASYKFFLTADPKVRAQRRYEELKSKGIVSSYEEILQNVLERDQLDSTRSIAPLKKAVDAIEIDTSDKTVEEILDLLKHYILA